MTNEQAIKELQESHDIMRNHDIDESESYLMQALNMAIKALQTQADGEKTCGTCRNEDTYHCAECENKSDYEQSQADGEYISKACLKEAIHTLYQGLKLTRTEDDVQKCIDDLPSVAIPSAEPYKGKTNGEVIKAVFPNFHTDEMSHTVWVGYDAMSFHRDWWNSPYSEGSD